VSTTTTSASGLSISICNFCAAYHSAAKAQATLTPIKKKRSVSPIQKRYATTQIGKYGVSFGLTQPDVPFCTGNDVFQFFSKGYPSTPRSQGQAIDDNGNDADDADRNLAEAVSAPNLPGIGKIEANSPFIDVLWEFDEVGGGPPNPPVYNVCGVGLTAYQDRFFCSRDPFFQIVFNSPAAGIVHQYDSRSFHNEWRVLELVLTLA
jgi:hypothetical protein